MRSDGRHAGALANVEALRELGRDRAHAAGGQPCRPVGEGAQNEIEKPARRGEALLEEDAAQERREEALDGRPRDACAPESLRRGGLVAAAAEELEHCGAVAHPDEPTGKRAQAAHRGVARVGEPPEAPVRADDRAPLEQAEVEPVEVEDRLVPPGTPSATPGTRDRAGTRPRRRF